MDLHKAASILGRQRSEKKSQAVRENGKAGGRPSKGLGLDAPKKKDPDAKKRLRKKAARVEPESED